MSNHKIKTWIEIPVMVEFKYQGRERPTVYYPGCPPSIDIEDIELPGDVKSWIFKNHKDYLEEECWEYLEYNQTL